jgi:hypothetical protein
MSDFIFISAYGPGMRDCATAFHSPNYDFDGSVEPFSYYFYALPNATRWLQLLRNQVNRVNGADVFESSGSLVIAV